MCLSIKNMDSEGLKVEVFAKTKKYYISALECGPILRKTLPLHTTQTNQNNN
jgi:hypothetical protein